MDKLSLSNMNIVNEYKYHLIGTFTFLITIKWLKTYFGGGVCKSKIRLDGKTVIVTGANTGIGKETSLDMAKRGARVIIACRDVIKGGKVAEDIRSRSGNGNVIVEKLDLSSFDSVVQFSKRINEKEEFVNILINNAGHGGLVERKTIENDIEANFGVNHISHFLLTNLLLKKLKSSTPSRVVNVASLAYKRGRMNWDDLMLEKKYHHQEAYRQSKLANILFTCELAKRIEGTGVTTYSLHPGVVQTDLGRHAQKYYGIFFDTVLFFFKPILWLVMKNPWQGAQTTIYCAIDENLSKSNGKYYADCKEEKLLPHALNDEDAIKLWNISQDLIKKYFIAI